MQTAPATPSSSTAHRLGIYRQLFDHLKGTREKIFSFWMQPFEGLPFRLGESLAEAKIPFAFDDALEHQAEAAVAQLLSLVCRRFGASLSSGTLSADTPLRDESMSSRLTKPDTLEQVLVSRASRIDPTLDCGLLDSWVARRTAGATLISSLHALFQRALEEEAKSRGSSRYAYVVILAAADLMNRKKSLVKSASIRAMSYERLEKAIGACLFTAVEVAAGAALAAYEKKKLSVDLRRTSLLPATRCERR